MRSKSLLPTPRRAGSSRLFPRLAIPARTGETIPTEAFASPPNREACMFTLLASPVPTVISDVHFAAAIDLLDNLAVEEVRESALIDGMNSIESRYWIDEYG